MKILAITQARLSSSRLPSKVLKKIGDITLLEIHLKRLLKSKLISNLKVAIANESGIEEIIEVANNLSISTFIGSIDNVLDRFYQASKIQKPNYIVRITSDCPLIDPELLDKIIEYTILHDLDYCSNTLLPTFPDGTDVEVFRFSALKHAFENANLTSELEHVTPYIWKNSSFLGGKIFKSDCFMNKEDFSNYRITVDTIEDFFVIEKLVHALGVDKSWREYVTYLEKEHSVFSINNVNKRNEGYQKSLNQDKNN